jgi:hypothetical protein
MVDELLHNTHNTTEGQFNYIDFVRTVKHGAAKDTDIEDGSVPPPNSGVGGGRVQVGSRS